MVYLRIFFKLVQFHFNFLKMNRFFIILKLGKSYYLILLKSLILLYIKLNINHIYHMCSETKTFYEKIIYLKYEFN